VELARRKKKAKELDEQMRRKAAKKKLVAKRSIEMKIWEIVSLLR